MALSSDNASPSFSATARKPRPVISRIAINPGDCGDIVQNCQCRLELGVFHIAIGLFGLCHRFPRHDLLHGRQRRRLNRRAGVGSRLTRRIGTVKLWTIINHAGQAGEGTLCDLRLGMATAQALLMQEELRNLCETAKRVAESLGEGFANKPWLKCYD
ncbi:MAG: hypothetical protein AAF744_03005 [Pseudomonadota bacterium]